MDTSNSLDLTAITWRLHSLTDVLFFMRSMKNKNDMRVVNNASNYYTEQYKKRLLNIDYNKHFRIKGSFTTPLLNSCYTFYSIYNIIIQIRNHLDSMPDKDSCSINKWKCYIITLEVLFKHWYTNWLEFWKNMRKTYSNYHKPSCLTQLQKENIFWELVDDYGNVYLFIKDICPNMFKIQNEELQRLFCDDNTCNDNITEKNLKRWNKMINSPSRSDFYPFIVE